MSSIEEAVFEHLRSIAARAIALGDDFAGRRQLIDEYFRMGGQSADVVASVHKADCNERTMEWVCAENADPDVRLLYIHGGSWVSGSLEGYRPLASRISQACGAAVLLVDYRLAPEYKFPCGLQDCMKAFLWMNNHGPKSVRQAKKNLICGDSAGGNLTLAAYLLLRRERLLRPDGLIALSAATDFTASSPSLVTRAESDPIIHPAVYSILAPVYLGDTNPRESLASPLFGDYSDAPPILLQVGSAEVLLDDSTRLAESVRSQNACVELQVWDEMPHVFQGFAPALPKANEAIAAIGEFVRKIVQDESCNH